MPTSKSGIPQALTLSRIPLAVIVVALLFYGQHRVAAAVYFIAELTDFFDGYLARRWSVSSSFGKNADLLADKVLIFLVVLTLYWLGVVVPTMAIIVCVREVAVTVLRNIARKHGYAQFLRTSVWGRYTSIILREALGAIIWFAEPNLTTASSAEMGFGAAMTVAWIGVVTRIYFFALYLWRDRQMILVIIRELTRTKVLPT